MGSSRTLKSGPLISFIFCVLVKTLNFLLHTPGRSESQLGGKFRFIELHSLASAGEVITGIYISYFISFIFTKVSSLNNIKSFDSKPFFFPVTFWISVGFDLNQSRIVIVLGILSLKCDVSRKNPDEPTEKKASH